jgi:hypothetical protein
VEIYKSNIKQIDDNLGEYCNYLQFWLNGVIDDIIHKTKVYH